LAEFDAIFAENAKKSAEIAQITVGNAENGSKMAENGAKMAKNDLERAISHIFERISAANSEKSLQEEKKWAKIQFEEVSFLIF
jgi:hypothetical protein